MVVDNDDAGDDGDGDGDVDDDDDGDDDDDDDDDEDDDADELLCVVHHYLASGLSQVSFCAKVQFRAGFATLSV